MFLSIIFFIKTHFPGDASCWQYNIGRPQWLIRASCGSKHRGTGFKSRAGRMCVIEVVHIQCVASSLGLRHPDTVTMLAVQHFSKSR